MLIFNDHSRYALELKISFQRDTSPLTSIIFSFENNVLILF